MRSVWFVGLWFLVVGSGHAESSPPLEEGDVATPNKPTAAEVVKMLQLDPKHEKVIARGFRDGIRWERSYDGIRVLNAGASSWRDGRRWRTRFAPSEVSPDPVRREGLLTPRVAIEKSAVANVPMKDPVAELVYFTTVSDRRKPWRTGLNAMDYVQTFSRFELVYQVHPRDPRNWSRPDVPAVYVDAYDGSIRAKATGIIVD